MLTTFQPRMASPPPAARHSEPASVQGRAWIGPSTGRGATLAPTHLTRVRPAAVRREANIGEGPNATLDGAFRERVRQTPDAVAYVQFDPATRRWQEATWAETAREVARWQVGLGTLGLSPGDRVAVMLGNGRDWVAFDQAALGLGLVTVPLYPGDRPDNVDWVLRDSGCRALLIEGREQWRALQPIAPTLSRLEAVISRRGIPADAPNCGTPSVGYRPREVPWRRPSPAPRTWRPWFTPPAPPAGPRG
jgi:acyl-CoA synthetase (AMP-forming)/AMP-acid ligase II